MKKLIPAILVLALPLASPAHAAGDCTEVERLAHPVGCQVQTSPAADDGPEAPALERRAALPDHEHELPAHDHEVADHEHPAPAPAKGEKGDRGPPGPAVHDWAAMGIANAAIPHTDRPFSLGLGVGTAAGVPAFALGIRLNRPGWRIGGSVMRSRRHVGVSGGIAFGF